LSWVPAAVHRLWWCQCLDNQRRQ